MSILSLACFPLPGADSLPNTPVDPDPLTLASQDQFSEVLTYGDYKFRVELNDHQLVVTPIGLPADKVQEQELSDVEIVDMAEVADLDANGSPEVYIYTKTTLPDANGKVYAFAMLGKNSMIPIYMPDIYDNVDAMTGYVGHDEFRVVETTLVRRFPKYEKNGEVSGTKQIQYKLTQGETGFAFKIDRITEY